MKQIKPIFVTGTGRCGTHFMAEVFKLSKQFNSYHNDDLSIINHDAFFRYAKFNELNIDHFEYFNFRKKLIENSNNQNKIYIESNPYLSCGLNELQKWFNPILIIMHRNPINVIKSFHTKGLYDRRYETSDSSKAHGPSPNFKLHRELGRIVPNQNLKDWILSPQIKKIMWWYLKSMENISFQLEGAQPKNIIHINLENFNHSYLQMLFQMLDLPLDIKPKFFEETKSSKPGKLKTQIKPFIYDENELLDFDKKALQLKKKICAIGTLLN